MKELCIHLNTNSPHPVSLKNIIKEKFGENINLEELTLKLIVAPNTSILIQDDLITFDDLTHSKKINHNFEFTLQKHSFLKYQFKLIPSNLKKHLSSTNKNKTQNKALMKKELTLQLVGEKSEANIQCACYGAEEHVLSFQTTQNHKAKETKSSLITKGAGNHYSKISCKNMIYVDKHAHGSIAEQINKNIILSKGAHILVAPQLKIENNKTRCKHGTATCKLDENHLFYLQCRGIELPQARQTLIESFLRFSP